MTVILTPEQRAEIRVRLDELMNNRHGMARVHKDITALLASDEAQVQQIAAALLIHHVESDEHGPLCAGCGEPGSDPCPTARALGLTS